MKKLPKTITIYITTSRVRRGIRKISAECPVAVAVRDALSRPGLGVYVVPGGTRIHPGPREWPVDFTHSRVLCRRINHYDATGIFHSGRFILRRI